MNHPPLLSFTVSVHDLDGFLRIEGCRKQGPSGTGGFGVRTKMVGSPVDYLMTVDAARCTRRWQVGPQVVL